MAVINGSFETAGPEEGQANGWIVTNTSSIMRYPGLDVVIEGFEDYEEGWTIPAVGASYSETDLTATCGAIVACSGATLASTPVGRLVYRGTTVGTSGATFTISASATEAGLMFQSTPYTPGTIDWVAGNYVVRLNVTGANANLTWVETHVCRVDLTCTPVASIGSLTGQSISLGTTGVKSMTVAGGDNAGLRDDTLYIVCVFQNAVGSGESATITPDQAISTPLLGDGQNDASLQEFGVGDIGFSLFGLSKPREDFEDAWGLPASNGLNNEGQLNDFDVLVSLAPAFDSGGTPEAFEDMEELWVLPQAGGPPYNESSEFTVGAKPTGSITTIPVANLLDTETFTIDDGYGIDETFEFNKVSGGTVGNILIHLFTQTTADEVRDAIVTAINGTALHVVASSGGTAAVTLQHDIEGTDGNVAITDTVADGDFVVIGMAGGTIDVTLTAALFDGAAQGFEDFENAWLTNQDSITVFTASELRKYGLGVGLPMGTYDFDGVPGSFVDGSAYTPPAEAATLLIQVTTTLAGSVDITGTVGYVDGGSVAGNSGPFVIDAGAVVGQIFEVSEDGGAANPGFEDVTSFTEGGAQQVGEIELFGFLYDTETFEQDWVLALPTS